MKKYGTKNNLIVALEMAAISKPICLAVKAGIDPNELDNVLKGATANSFNVSLPPRSGVFLTKKEAGGSFQGKANFSSSQDREQSFPSPFHPEPWLQRTPPAISRPDQNHSSS